MFRIHDNSRISSVPAKYSDSHVDIMIIVCLLDFHNNGEPFHRIAKPYVERRSLGLSSHDESKYPIRLEFEVARRSVASTVPFMYRSTLLIAIICCLLGLLANCANQVIT